MGSSFRTIHLHAAVMNTVIQEFTMMLGKYVYMLMLHIYVRYITSGILNIVWWKAYIMCSFNCIHSVHLHLPIDTARMPEKQSSRFHSWSGVSLFGWSRHAVSLNFHFPVMSFFVYMTEDDEPFCEAYIQTRTWNLALSSSIVAELKVKLHDILSLFC